MHHDVTMLRAIANALWPSLRRNRWRTHTVTRDLSKHNPRGYTAGPRSATVPTAPSANAVVELHHESYITALLFAEDWPGSTSHALRLDYLDYIHATTRDGPIGQLEFIVHLRSATCRQPFHQQANRHGILRLRRNAMDEHITPAVATVLERIAAATQVRPISEAHIDAFLIEDHEIDLARVQAAVGL